MKTLSGAVKILVITLSLSSLRLNAGETPEPAAIATGDAAIGAAPELEEPGLTLNLHGVPLQLMLEQMSTAAGYAVHVRPNVSLTGTVQAWSHQPMSPAEALDLLNEILDDHGLTALQEGRLLTIVRRQDAAIETPIRLGNKADEIRRDAVMVTQIIPVRTLNVNELLKLLPPLLPTDTRLSANEAANSLIMTDTQANIRRVVEICRALDSISASVNSLRVLPLKYADASTVTALIKDLFAPQATSRGGGGAGTPNPTFGRGRGAGRGAGNPAAGSASDGQTPVTRVAAVADEHSNSVILSAPDDLMQTIEDLVMTLDHPVQDITEYRTFQLVNADPVETADLLANLYPDENSSTDSSMAPVLAGSQGVGAGPNGRARQGNSGAARDPGDHMKKLGTVLAVPDPRTRTLIVSASKDLMPQIEEIIARLDADASGHMGVHVVKLQYADASDVRQILLDLFPSTSTASAGAAQTSALETRRLAMQQQQTTATTTAATSTPGATRSSLP